MLPLGKGKSPMEIQGKTKSKGKQKRGILSLFFLHSYFQFALERTHKAFTGSQAAYRFLRASAN